MKTTSLNYKNLPDEEAARFVRSKRTKLKKSSTRHKRKRFIQSPISSEADLASHVQTVYSSDFEELLGDDQTGSCNEDLTKKLQRHPALVLNADYQPLRMLPLSTWSWQDAVKAVLGGKAVVVDTYPDVSVRAVSISMPVPSVIALREYAPSGKMVRVFYL